MQAKDWVGMSIAVVAFGFSAVSFYNTSIKRHDDLKVIVNDGPYLNIDREKKKFNILMRADLTFINAGNRFAGISGLKVVLEQNNGNENIKEGCGPGVEIPFVVEPFVIEPGKLVLMKYSKFAEGWKRDAEGQWISIPFGIGDAKRDGKVCLLFSFVTPDNAVDDFPLPMFVRRFALQAQADNDGPTESFVKPNSPVTLTRKHGYRLFD
jgi:hypothetical protein